MKLAFLIPVLALGACQAVGAPTAERIATVRTAADAKVADAAKALSDNCFLVRTAISVGEAFARGATVKRRLAQAAVVVDSYCSGPPPADIAGALVRLAAIYRDVNNAVPEVKAHMPDGV
jgi:hypothetical protein